MLDQLAMAGLVPVIKIDRAQDAVPLCEALKNGGLPVAEITFRTAAAEEAIRLVHRELPDMLLGAGTVLTCEQADRARAAGAGYIVTPGLNPMVVQHCIDKGYPVIPGCAGPSDIETALGLGLHTVKFFPAEALGGVKMIKALLGPYNMIKFVPTGGIGEKNLMDYLSIPQVSACGGSFMVPQDAIEAGDWERVRRLTAQAVGLVLGFHIRHVGLNNENEEQAREAAQKLSLLTGWAMEKEGPKGLFVGDGFELMKQQGRGYHGHIAIGTKSVARAMWHLKMRGFRFDESSVQTSADGTPRFVYLEDEIAGFAIHLILV